MGRPSLRSGREIGFAVAVRFWARAIFTDLVCAGDQFGTRSDFWELPALIWVGVCCAIYSMVAASLWCLDREALPLVLSASLLARGICRRSRINRALCFLGISYLVLLNLIALLGRKEQ